MNTFEITIQRKSGDTWPVVVEHSQPGILLPLRSEGNLCLTAEDLQRLTSLLGQVKDYGTLLGKALLQDEVRDGFVRALSQNEETLRVLLFIEAPDKELRTLRWERLCAPIDGDWQILAINQRVPFSFYIPAITDRLFPPIGRRDLRALVLVASPSDSQKYKLDTFDVEATVKSVRAALGNIPTDVLATVDGAIGLPTLDELCTQLTDRTKQYTMLHFVSHGRVLDDGETLLYWSKADNTVEVVTATRLLERLRPLRGARGLPHFTFLCTCESASPEAEAGLGGLGQRLVRDLGMPAVVAMTEKVTIKTAQALTEKFYFQLRESGEVDSALHEATASLAERGDIAVPALFSRLGGRPLFSDQLDRDLTNAEIQYGLERLVKLLPERSPILEKRFTELAQQLGNTLGADVTALSKPALKERSQALEEINNFCEEILDLNFHALALDQQPPTYDSRCPFRGLYPFRVENREFFFGREQLITQLQQKLSEDNFLAVLGASGSGKSSLVLAALIPMLQEKQADLQFTYMTPSSHPIEKLQISLSQLQAQSSILVIDQFEELFTLCADEAERVTFIEKLLSLIPHQKVVITMRADFWGECAIYRNLKDLMEARQKLIGPMDAAELRKAMEMQAAQVGLRFEPGLSNSILDDVQGEPGAMPLLQHALLELWKRRHGRWLRAVEYEAIGGVNMAIAQTADDVYNSLSASEQDQVKNIFIRLTRLDENAFQGEKRRDTRRRVWLDELVPAGGDLADTKQLVQRLAGEGARLVVTSVDESTNRQEVEVAHEALIRYWPRLLKWLDDNRINLQLRETIRQAALDWEKQQKDENYLVHRGGRLENAQLLAKQSSFLNQVEAEYVDTCVKLRLRQEKEKEAHHRREIRTAWGIAGGAVVALIVSTGFWVQAEIQKQQAEIAQAKSLARYSLSLLNDNQDLDALIEVIKAANILKKQKLSDPLIIEALQKIVYGVRERNILIGHGGKVASVVFSPNNQILASASDDKTIKLWNVKTGEVLHTLTEHKAKVNSVVFSPDGQILASASDDKTVKLWNIKTGKVIHTFTEHKANVNSVVFSPKGENLATASDDKTIEVLNVKNYKKIHTFSGHEKAVTSVVFSQDGQNLATTSDDKTVKLWNVKTGGVIHTLKGEQYKFNSVVFSPDSKTVATASDDKSVKLWNVQTGKVTHIFKEHQEKVNMVVFSRDGQTLASASDDNTARLWDVKSRKEQTRFYRHQDNVNSVIFSNDGKLVASTSNDNTVKIWDLNGKEQLTFQGGEFKFNSAVFSHDSKILATASDDKTIRIWDLQGKKLKIIPEDNQVFTSIVFNPKNSKILASGSDDKTVKIWDIKDNKDDKHDKKPQIFRGHNKRIRSIVFSPDGKTLATASDDKTAKIWDLNGKVKRTFEGHKGSVTSIVFSPDGKTIATASDDKTAKLWNVEDGKERQISIKHNGKITSIVFSPDGKTIATASDDKTAKLWNVEDGKERQISIKHNGKITSIVFSPDGKTIATASDDKTAKLWDVKEGKDRQTFTGHHGVVIDLVFSPDGKTLATASYDHTVKLWNVEDGKELQTFSSHKSSLTSLAFSPDGKTLATASFDNTIILWHLDELTPVLLLNGACDWVRDYLKNSQEVKAEDKSLCNGIPRSHS